MKTDSRQVSEINKIQSLGFGYIMRPLQGWFRCHRQILQQILRMEGIDKLVICGAMTHMCIDTTVRAAFDLGFHCEVIAPSLVPKKPGDRRKTDRLDA